MNIVFLEDDTSFAAEIVLKLQAAGHQVTHFAAGRACLKALNEFQYDLALLDWEVPDMTGLRYCRASK
jgi:DNA-binding response OmpR family regulator